MLSSWLMVILIFSIDLRRLWLMNSCDPTGHPNKVKPGSDTFLVPESKGSGSAVAANSGSGDQTWVFPLPGTDLSVDRVRPRSGPMVAMIWTTCRSWSGVPTAVASSARAARTARSGSAFFASLLQG